jgi:F-type H+-transporting ATPase subunit a
MFILVLNLLGLMPYFFTVTSHIAVTAALAVLVMVLVIGYGFYRNGLGFMKLFVPHGVPGYLLPLVSSLKSCPSFRGRSAFRCVSSPTCWPATSP